MERPAYFLMLDEFAAFGGSAAFPHLLTKPAVIIFLALQGILNNLAYLLGRGGAVLRGKPFNGLLQFR